MTAGVTGHDGSVPPAGPYPAERPTEPFRQVAPPPPPVARPSARWAIPDIGETGGPGERNGRARVAGMPNASPWQRSHAVWHRAGIDWVHGSVDEPSAADQQAAPPIPTPERGTVPVRKTRRRRGLVLASALLVALVTLVAGVGGYAVLREEDSGSVTPPPSAKLADRLFALDPAAETDGLVQELTAVAAEGDTVVALGGETGGPDRARFVVSADDGQGWRLASVRSTDGAEPAPGDIPRLLAGGSGRWVALGGPVGAPGTAVWTSGDGLTWIRHPGADAAFRPADRVHGVARTTAGFMAVGTSDGKGVLWTSGDGARWQRTDALGIGDVVRLDRIAAVGHTVVVQGAMRRKVTRTEQRGGKPRKVTRTVQEGGLWRTADGGRQWTRVDMPQAQGSYGGPVAVVGGPHGFFAVREGKRTSGPKQRRKTARYGVVFTAGDGLRWKAIGRVEVPGHSAVSWWSGSGVGLAVAIRLGNGRAAVLRSVDGRDWQRSGEVPAAEVRGLASLAGGVLVVGRRADDAYLIPPGASEIGLASVPGAVRAERTVASVVADGGRLVVVGSGNGAAAAWTSADGRVFTRGTGLSGTRLTDVVRGGQGYLAVGQEGGDPVAFTSGDGVAWQQVSLPGGGLPETVAYGPGGYVVAGKVDSSALTWHSADLQSWTRSSDTGSGWMRDVTAVSSGFAAVGGRSEDGTNRPSVWTSSDGRRWTAAAAPALPPGLTSGTLSRVAARGDTLVAFGSGTGDRGPQPFLTVSADAGRTWQAQPLPGGDQNTGLTAITPTSAGFVLAGTTGDAGRRDVAVWSTADGRAWHPEQAQGTGLTGAGSQWLNALTVVGADLVGIGMTGDHRGDTPTLWRRPLS